MSKKTEKIGIILSIFLFFSAMLIINSIEAYAMKIGTVVIDPGHGWEDSGAKAGGVEERHMNAQLAYKVAMGLKSQGHDVYFSHDIGYTMNQNDIPALINYHMGGSQDDICNKIVPAINQKRPDIMISIHHNAYKDAGPTGIESYWRSQGTPADTHAKSKELAKKLADACRGIRNIRVHHIAEDKVFWINGVQVPSVLMECGFMTTPGDLAQIVDQNNQQALANNFVSAINQYFDKYGSKTKINLSATCDKISIVKSSTNSSTFTVIAEGVRGNNSIAKVRFPIFKNGQLISWQEGTYLGHEAWAFSYNALSQPGSYGVHVYVGDIHGSEVCAGSTGAQDEIAVLQGAQTANNVVYSKKSDSCVSLFSVIAEGVSGAGNAAVHFAFSPPGQAFSWNGAKYTGANTWVLTFNSTLNGVYNIHAYRDINRSCIGAIQFASQIENPTMEKFEFTRSGANNQILTLTVHGLKSLRGVAAVKLPIFRNGQLQGWHDATCIGEGVWSLSYNATNNPGSYGAHVYVYDKYGYGFCVHATDANNEVKV